MTTPSLREAAKMALEVCEQLNRFGNFDAVRLSVKAERAINAALALPEPEPVTDAVRVNLIECLREHAKFACIEGNEKRMVLQAADMLSLPESAPVAWNISYTNANGEARKVTHGHNAIGDYRMFDPHAISTPLYASPQPAQVERQPLTLTGIDALAKLYALSYASPHHATFTVDGLRSLIEAAQGIGTT